MSETPIQVSISKFKNLSEMKHRSVYMCVSVYEVKVAGAVHILRNTIFDSFGTPPPFPCPIFTEWWD